MPSVFETLKRLVAGQPVFTTSEDTKSQNDDSAGWKDQNDQPVIKAETTQLAPDQSQQSDKDARGFTNPKEHESHYTQPGKGSAVPIPTSPNVPKEPGAPQVVVQNRLTCIKNQNDTMELQVNIRNYSDRMIWLDKIELLGTKHEVDDELKPGHEKEYTVYRGPRPKNTQYNKIELQYRTEPEREYYESRHIIEFQKQSDDTYLVHSIKFVPPVGDMRW